MKKLIFLLRDTNEFTEAALARANDHCKADNILTEYIDASGMTLEYALETAKTAFQKEGGNVRQAFINCLSTQ